MKKLNLPIPAAFQYLPENFDEKLREIAPEKVILSKVLCGCGATESYLQNDSPVLLLSPRRELLLNKVNSKNPRRWKLHYCEREEGKRRQVTQDKLRQYLYECRQDQNIPKYWLHTILVGLQWKFYNR